MNREIKFRVWTNAVMCYNISEIEFIHDCIVFSDHPEGVSSAILSDSVLMQFTGLTDKNGVEIYEDDIWQYPMGWNGKGDIIYYHTCEVKKRRHNSTNTWR